MDDLKYLSICALEDIIITLSAVGLVGIVPQVGHLPPILALSSSGVGRP